MKLAVSNIAWDAPEDDAVKAALRAGGVHGIEVAPTKFWPDWEGMSVAAATAERQRLADSGFAVPALQAILFGRPDLQVFGDEASVSALVAHIADVATVAAAFEARTLVFGSPRNRDPGELKPDAAIDRAVAVFRRIGAVCADHGVVLGLEANPPAYACTFMTRWSEAAAVVRLVDHPGVRLHLDIACTEMAGDQAADGMREAADIISHLHITEPQLGDLSDPQMNHFAFGAAIAASGYADWASIEMRRADDPVAAVTQAVAFARANYPIAPPP